MGSAPNSTKGNIPDNPKIWKDKIPPDKDYLHYNYLINPTDNLKPNLVYNNNCSNCNGDGCSAFRCSAATRWEPCNIGPPAQLYDATGQVYTPEGHEDMQMFQSCEATCPSKTLCYRPDIEACYLGPDSNGEEPTYRVDWADDCHLTDNPALKCIKCTYDMTKITEAEQIKNYIKMFKPSPNDPQFYELMLHFSSLQTKSCLNDPTTGGKISSCSLVTATAEDPRTILSKEWFNGLNDNLKDAFISTYCTNDSLKANAECKCENRYDLPEFVQSKKYISDPIQDGCIFVPCKGSPAFLVNSRDRQPTCPEAFCQIAYNITDVQGSVIIENNKNYLACSVNKDPAQPNHPTPEKPKVPFKKEIYNQLLIGATCGYIILIFCLIIFSKKSKKSI